MLKGLKAECPVHKMPPNECSCSDYRLSCIGHLIRASMNGAVTVYRQLGNYCTNEQLYQWASILAEGN